MSHLIDNLQRIVEKLTGLNEAVQLQFIATILLFFFAWLLHRIFSYVFSARFKDKELIYRMNKIAEYTLCVLAMILTMRIWFGGIQSFVTLFSLLAATLVIVSKEPVQNMMAWFFIMIKKPFALGDRIEISNVKGDVIDQGFLNFTLMEIGNWTFGEQSTGRIVKVPNHKVFSENIYNYNQGFQYIWDEIALYVTLTSDWQKAKMMITDIISTCSKGFSLQAEEEISKIDNDLLINYSKLTPVVYVNLMQGKIELVARYLCEYKKRRVTQSAIWEAVLKKIQEEQTIQLV